MQRYIVIILIALVVLTMLLTIVASIKRSNFNFTETVFKEDKN